MRKPFTVKQLRELIAKAPDNAVVVTSAFDRGYTFARPELTTALHTGGDGMAEDFGEDTTPESEYGKRIPVLLIA